MLPSDISWGPKPPPIWRRQRAQMAKIAVTPWIGAGGVPIASSKLIMNKKVSTGKVVVELATPVIAWALTKFVEAPRVQKALAKADRKVVKNAKANRAYVTAGAAAVVLGLGLIARGTAKK